VREEDDDDEVGNEETNVFQHDEEIDEESEINEIDAVETQENLDEGLESAERNNNVNDTLTFNEAITQESENEGANVDDGMTLRRGRRVDYASLHKKGVSHMQVKGAKCGGRDVHGSTKKIWN